MKSHRLKGGMQVLEDLQDFASDQWTNLKNNVSDLTDLPIEINNTLGDGIHRASEYAGKYGVGPYGDLVSRAYDTVSATDRTLENRSNSDIFSHPELLK